MSVFWQNIFNFTQHMFDFEEISSSKIVFTQKNIYIYSMCYVVCANMYDGMVDGMCEDTDICICDGMNDVTCDGVCDDMCDSMSDGIGYCMCGGMNAAVGMVCTML